MAVSFQYLSLSSTLQRNPCLSLRFAPFRFPNALHFQTLDHKIRSPSLNLASIDARRFIPRVSTSGGVGRRDIDVDSLLSAAELVCLVSSSLASVGFALNCVRASSKSVFGDRVFVGAILMLVAGVGIGAWIRKRQWIRINRETAKGVVVASLMERADKLEGDWGNLATLTLLLSRQHKKLGVRFRATHKALKKPIEETAALAQKTSEATRALTVRGDILQKELATMHNILLAMQANLQKQLNLILAIGKSGKIWESKQEHSEGQSHTGTHDPIDEPSNQNDVQDI